MAPFSLAHILKRAAAHPSYAPLFHKTTSTEHSEDSNDSQAPSLSLADFDFLPKSQLLSSFQHLIATDPDFLKRAYLSPTGGTRGETSQLYYVSDIFENMQHRVDFVESVVKPFGIFAEGEVAMNLIAQMGMNRCQDLGNAMIDLSGATNLPIGYLTSEPALYEFIKRFNVTVIHSTPSTVMQFARWIENRFPGGPAQSGVKIKKVVYAAEPLSPNQEVYLHKTLGVEALASLYGSAEAGPIMGHPPCPIRTTATTADDRRHIAARSESEITTTVQVSGQEVSPNYREFVFDHRMLVVEIIREDGSIIASSLEPATLPPTTHGGNKKFDPAIVGEIILTSLSRARNPLVRYKTGDLGSLHRFEYNPEWQQVRKGLNPEHYTILRLHGRECNKSFFIDGETMNISEVDANVFEVAEAGWPSVLEWQVIIDSGEADKEGAVKLLTGGDRLEFRVVTTEGSGKTVSEVEKHLTEKLREGAVGDDIEFAVRVVGYDGLERTGLMTTQRKVRKIVDRRA